MSSKFSICWTLCILLSSDKVSQHKISGGDQLNIFPSNWLKIKHRQTKL